MKIGFTGFIAFLAIALVSFVAPKATYKVDTQSSEVKWKGEKMTGEHTGAIEIKSGELMMEGGKLTGGNFTIDMTTINNEDLEGDNKSKLEGHLKSDDFFGVSNHPEAKLTITDVKAEKKDEYEITGDLTIKGITEPVTFPATISTKKGKVTAEAEITVDRTKYDIKYGSGSFFEGLGDKMIYDEFELTVKLVAQQ